MLPKSAVANLKELTSVCINGFGGAQCEGTLLVSSFASDAQGHAATSCQQAPGSPAAPEQLLLTVVRRGQ